MEIEVRLKDIDGRKNLQMYYRDPITEKTITRSAGTHIKRDAERKAARWEEELRAGTAENDRRILWDDFRTRCEDEHLVNLSTGAQGAAHTAMNHFERVINPKRLASVTTANMAKFIAELRKEGMKATTLAGHIGHFKAVIGWGVSMELLAKRPIMKLPRTVKGQKLMRGRPITDKEFGRIIEAIPKVRKLDPERWEHYMRGMYLSGLRLSESLIASWDAKEPFSVDLSDTYPQWRIYGEAQKARRDELLPMTPDFAEFLLQTPVVDRHGPVFDLNGLQTGKPITPKRLCRIISGFGKKANVITDEAKEQFATCHDLRRSFGTRWASRVSPADLQKLMRHANIQTTMKYYVQQDSQDVAARIWDVSLPGDTSGDTAQNDAASTEARNKKTPETRSF